MSRTEPTIVLTHAYVLQDDPKERVILKPYPPLGILSIAAWLRERGYRPEVFDMTFRTHQELLARLEENPPDLLGIYTNLMTRPRVVELIGNVRARLGDRAPLILLGGPEVTAHVEEFLDHGADVIAIGEGESTTQEIVEVVAGSREMREVDGIAWRHEGITQRTPPRTLMRDLSELPFPARDLIDLERYQQTWRGAHGRSAVSISTMRGCPYTCRWCSRAVYGNSYRRRPAEKVVDEIAHIAEVYRPDTLWFVDDVFTISPKWMRAFAGEVGRRGVSIPYECITRADRLDEEMIDLLVASGCYRVWIGAESGSQRIIDAMDRRVSVEQVRKMMRLSGEKGLETGTFIMLGYPGETTADILETIHHLKECRADHFTVTLAYPIAGTPLYEEVRSDLLEVPAWGGSTDRDLHFPRTYDDRYYRHALRRLSAEVELDRMRREGSGNVLERGKLTAKIALSRVGMALHGKSRSTGEEAGGEDHPSTSSA